MWKKTFTLTLAVFYLVSQVVLGHATETNIWDERRTFARLGRASADTPAFDFPPIQKNFQLSRLPLQTQTSFHGLPLTHVSIQDVFEAGKQSQGKVVLIQDIHLNAEAQANIAHALQELVNQKKVNVIGVEGAFGPFDLKLLRSFQDKETVKKVSRIFLDKNLMAAPSFVGVTSEIEPVLIGIDDKKNYEANVQAYLNSRVLEKDMTAKLGKESRRLTEEKKRALNPELKRFDDLRGAYRKGTVSLGAYVERINRHSGMFLAGIVNQNRSTAFEFNDPSLKHAGMTIGHFLEAYQLEQSLNFTQVEHERRRVLDKLAQKLNEHELARLLAQSMSYRMGRLGFGAYYQGLKELCLNMGIDLRQTPAFDDYIRYVLLSDGIKAEELFAALEEMEKDILAQFIQTPEEKLLIDQSERLYLTEKLVKFELTPKEWAAYSQKRIPRGESSLRAFEKFYEQADIRSQKIVENLRSAAADDALALVVGGFHTPHITQLLKEKQISYIVASPKITKVDEAAGSAYLSIFAREKTPLDRLFTGEKLFINPPMVNVQAPELATPLAVEFADLCAGPAPDGITKINHSNGRVVEIGIHDKSIFVTKESPPFGYLNLGSRPAVQSGAYVESIFTYVGHTLNRSSQSMAKAFVELLAQGQYSAAQRLYQVLAPPVDQEELNRQAYKLHRDLDLRSDTTWSGMRARGREILEAHNLVEAWIKTKNLKEAMEMINRAKLGLVSSDILDLILVFYKERYFLDVDIITTERPNDPLVLDGNKKPMPPLESGDLNRLIMSLWIWSSALSALPYPVVNLTPLWTRLVIGKSGREAHGIQSGAMKLTLNSNNRVLLHEIGHALDPQFMDSGENTTAVDFYQDVHLEKVKEFSERRDYVWYKEPTGYKVKTPFHLRALSYLLQQMYVKRRDLYKILKRGPAYYAASKNRHLGQWAGLLADLKEERNQINVIGQAIDIALTEAYEFAIQRVEDQIQAENWGTATIGVADIVNPLRKEIEDIIEKSTDWWIRYAFEVRDGDVGEFITDSKISARLRQHHTEWFAEMAHLHLGDILRAQAEESEALQMIDPEMAELLAIILPQVPSKSPNKFNFNHVIEAIKISASPVFSAFENTVGSNEVPFSFKGGETIHIPNGSSLFILGRVAVRRAVEKPEGEDLIMDARLIVRHDKTGRVIHLPEQWLTDYVRLKGYSHTEGPLTEEQKIVALQAATLIKMDAAMFVIDPPLYSEISTRLKERLRSGDVLTLQTMHRRSRFVVVGVFENDVVVYDEGKNEISRHSLNKFPLELIPNTIVLKISSPESEGPDERWPQLLAALEKNPFAFKTPQPLDHVMERLTSVSLHEKFALFLLEVKKRENLPDNMMPLVHEFVGKLGEPPLKELTYYLLFLHQGRLDQLEGAFTEADWHRFKRVVPSLEKWMSEFFNERAKRHGHVHMSVGLIGLTVIAAIAFFIVTAWIVVFIGRKIRALRHEKRDRLFDEYLKETLFGDYEHLRPLFSRELKDILLADPVLTPVFLVALSDEQMGNDIEYFNDAVMAQWGGEEVLRENSVFSTGTPEVADAMARSGKRIVVAVTDRRTSKDTLHPPFAVANARTAYIPIQQGGKRVWLVIKGAGLVNSREGIAYDGHLGLAGEDEALRSQQANQRLSQAAAHVMTFVGSRRLYGMPDSRKGQACLLFYVTDDPVPYHRHVKFPQITRSDPGLQRLRRELGGLSVQDYWQVTMRRLGQSAAALQNAGLYPETNHLQDFTMAGYQSDISEALLYEDYTSEDQHFDDMRVVKETKLSLANLHAKLSSLLHLMSYARREKQLEALFGVPDEQQANELPLYPIKALLERYFESLGEEYRAVWRGDKGLDIVARLMTLLNEKTFLIERPVLQQYDQMNVPIENLIRQMAEKNTSGGIMDWVRQKFYPEMSMEQYAREAYWRENYQLYKWVGIPLTAITALAAWGMGWDMELSLKIAIAATWALFFVPGHFLDWTSLNKTGPPNKWNVVYAPVIAAINITLLFLPWSTWFVFLKNPIAKTVFYGFLFVVVFDGVHYVVNKMARYLSKRRRFYDALRNQGFLDYKWTKRDLKLALHVVKKKRLGGLSAADTQGLIAKAWDSFYRDIDFRDMAAAVDKNSFRPTVEELLINLGVAIVKGEIERWKQDGGRSASAEEPFRKIWGTDIPMDRGQRRFVGLVERKGQLLFLNAEWHGHPLHHYYRAVQAKLIQTAPSQFVSVEERPIGRLKRFPEDFYVMHPNMAVAKKIPNHPVTWVPGTMTLPVIERYLQGKEDSILREDTLAVAQMYFFRGRYHRWTPIGEPLAYYLPYIYALLTVSRESRRSPKYLEWDFLRVFERLNLLNAEAQAKFMGRVIAEITDTSTQMIWEITDEVLNANQDKRVILLNIGAAHAQLFKQDYASVDVESWAMAIDAYTKAILYSMSKPKLSRFFIAHQLIRDHPLNQTVAYRAPHEDIIESALEELKATRKYYEQFQAELEEESEGQTHSGGLMDWVRELFFWRMSRATYNKWAFVLENAVFALFIGLPVGLALSYFGGFDALTSIKIAAATTLGSFTIGHLPPLIEKIIYPFLDWLNAFTGRTVVDGRAPPTWKNFGWALLISDFSVIPLFMSSANTLIFVTTFFTVWTIVHFTGNKTPKKSTLEDQVRVLIQKNKGNSRGLLLDLMGLFGQRAIRLDEKRTGVLTAQEIIDAVTGAMTLEELNAAAPTVALVMSLVLTEEEYKGFMGRLNQLLSDSEENSIYEDKIYLSRDFDTATTQMNEIIAMAKKDPLVFVYNGSGHLPSARGARVINGAHHRDIAAFINDPSYRGRLTMNQIKDRKHRFMVLPGAQLPPNYFDPLIEGTIDLNYRLFMILEAMQAVEIPKSHLPSWQAFQKALLSA